MNLNIKAIQNIMRNDAGVNGDAQRIEQIVWILFLKIYDLYEKKWIDEAEFMDKTYKSIIPENLAWDKWAKSTNNQGQAIKDALTGEKLLNFVNNELFPTLKELQITKNTKSEQQTLKVFKDAHNYMKDGYLLRQVINEIDKLEINSDKDRQDLSFTYEKFLKDLQSAGNAGEFYTPRAVTDFVMQILQPKFSDKIADLACGTGGFLNSAFHYLNNKKPNATELDSIKSAFYGIEKKQLPFILCVTNFLINGIEKPNLDHENAFETFDNLDDLRSSQKFDIIAMNPPYGGKEKANILNRFPKEFQSSETADLFMYLITERLAEEGKAVVVLPDGFLFGNDGAKIALKKRLLNDFNLHLIVRLPAGVFSPYTGITTNILFFDRDDRGTAKTAFYRLDMPENIKSFGKTKSIELSHFEPFREWERQNRPDLEEANGNFKAKTYTKEELESKNYNFDLCGYVKEEEEILEPFELIEQIKTQRDSLNATLNGIMQQIEDIIKANQ